MAVVYKAPGLIWDEGEIPACHYCKAKADKVTLYGTDVMDWVVCDKDHCRIKLAKESIRGRVTKIRVRKDSY